MIRKYSNSRLSLIIILVLSGIILIISLFYLAERVKHTIEKEYLKEKLTNTNLYFYQVQVESPLKLLLNYLSVRPVEDVEWDEQLTQETISIFRELDRGIANSTIHSLDEFPGGTWTALQTLQKKAGTILNSLESEQPLDENTKEKIMNFTQAIDRCVVFEYSRSWEQITLEVECLNK